MVSAQDSRKLKTIITSKRATDAFFKGSMNINRADEIAVLENPEQGDPLLKRISDIDDDLKHIPLDKLESINSDKLKRDIISSLSKTIQSICKQLNIDV